MGDFVYERSLSKITLFEEGNGNEAKEEEYK